MKEDTKADSQNIIDMDATQISANIKQDKITSLKAVHAYTKHITRVNPNINAMVETRFAEAEADATEINRMMDNSGRLNGVPVSVKESFDIKGMKTTSDLLNREDAWRNEDAQSIRIYHGRSLVQKCSGLPKSAS